jgi:hypothetical protein
VWCSCLCDGEWLRANQLAADRSAGEESKQNATHAGWLSLNQRSKAATTRTRAGSRKADAGLKMRSMLAVGRGMEVG